MSGEDQKNLASPHLGTIARDLRQAAGLTRRAFGEQVNLSESVIKSFETGRILLSTEQLQPLLRHPVMQDLPNLAHAAGIEPTPGKKG